jgi:uncharacterized protein (DUF2267 family)
VKAHDLVSAVSKSAGLSEHAHAESAVRATLAVLGQRLSTEARDLAAQLPPELAGAVPTDGATERFGLEEFYRRVADREGSGCTPEQARQHARAVTAGLREALGEQYSHLLAQLPDDYADLMHTEPATH